MPPLSPPHPSPLAKSRLGSTPEGRADGRESAGIRRAFIGSLLLFATACHAQVERRSLPSAVVQQKNEQLDPALMRQVMGERDGDAYRIGPGDSLLVAVYGHPELSIGQYLGSSASSRPTGLKVDNDGTIQLPLIGSVKVAGKTAEQMRSLLERELGLYVKEPKVTVQVLFAGSIRYHLLGQFTDPGLKYSDRPMRLLEALSLGGSIQLERASLNGAYVARAGRKLPVDFQGLLRNGDLKQNIPLKPGDVIFVPDSMSDRVFVFGGSVSSNPGGGAVPFVGGRLNLLQALAQAGFGVRERAQTRLSKTVVIRSRGDEGEFFLVDAKQILEGEAAPFPLSPGDVVYVPNRAFTNWNEALNQLIPTLQAVGGVLQPFVQIRFLQRN